MSKESLELLRPDPANARQISREALSGLRYSMDEFGDLAGIVWNARVGELIAGHQRMRVLKAAGAKGWERLSPEHGEIQHPKTGERFAIRIVDWPADKHREAQIVANNVHIQGEYTEEVVAQLRQLEAQNAEAFEKLRLEALAEDHDQGPDDLDEHDGLEDFDARPRPRPTWIMVAAPEDAAAEIESLLRERFGADPGVRIERSSNLDGGGS